MLSFGQGNGLGIKTSGCNSGVFHIELKYIFWLPTSNPFISVSSFCPVWFVNYQGQSCCEERNFLLSQQVGEVISVSLQRGCHVGKAIWKLPVIKKDTDLILVKKECGRQTEAFLFQHSKPSSQWTQEERIGAYGIMLSKSAVLFRSECGFSSTYSRLSY